jgi:hypothetical protein
MTRYCLNCGHAVEGKYCSYCSQSINVGPITWKSFGYEFIHALTHAEKGILGTTWQLIKNPGKVLNEYIEGKRKKYHPPAGFFLIWVTLSIIVHRIVIAHTGFKPVILRGLTFSSVKSIEAFIIHGEWFYILTFPLSALLFYLIVIKPRYSYIESIVITMYSFSVTYMFFVICYLAGGFIFSLNVLHWKFYLFQILLSLAYLLWVSISLLKNKSIKYVWLRLSIHIIANSIVVLKFIEFLSNSWVKMEEYFK